MFFITAIHHSTLFIIVRICQVVIQLICSTGNSYTVVLSQRSTPQRFILPIYPFTIGIVSSDITIFSVQCFKSRNILIPIFLSSSIVHTAFIIQHCKLCRRKNIQFLGYFFETDIAVKSYRSLAFFTTTFCSNNYNAVSTTSSINSRSRRILQNIDSLNFSRVERRHTIFAGKTIDNIKRLIALCNRNTSTDTNRNRSSRRTFTLHYLYTGHTSCQCLGNITCRHFGKFLTVHRCHRPSQVLTLNRGITDCYYFIQ